MLPRPKAFYRDLAARPEMQGYEWSGWDVDEGLHSFVKEHPETREEIAPGVFRITERKWSEVRCRETEIDDGSLALLIRIGMTR